VAAAVIATLLEHLPMRRPSPAKPPRESTRSTARPGSSVARRPLGNGASITQPSVGESTYRRVRADIVYGRLAPGQKLTLERMRGAYGSAVSTLREIFNGLASEGLITAEGARGFEVAAISPDNLREVAAMRQLLECDALRSSFEAGDVEWEGRVVAAHHKLASFEKRLAAGDRTDEEALRRYDWEFHNALISACGSRLLIDMHASIYDKYLRYLMLAAVFRGTPVVEEHRKLLTCALARDWRAAQLVTATHIQDCVAQMLGGDWWMN
jgi:DNA-binding GntR family transcriptional regulator